MQIKVGDKVKYRGSDTDHTAEVIVGPKEVDGLKIVEVRWDRGGVTEEAVLNLLVVKDHQFKVGDKVTTVVGDNTRLSLSDGFIVATAQESFDSWCDYDYKIASESDPTYIRWFYEAEVTLREDVVTEKTVTEKTDPVLLKATEDIMEQVAMTVNRPEEGMSPVGLSVYTYKRLQALAKELEKG